MKATDFSGKWDEFMLQLSKEELAGAEQPPQLLLCCQDGAMSVRLAGGIPDAARAMLAGEVETIGFDDGRGAVRFPLRAGGDILGFLGETTGRSGWSSRTASPCACPSPTASGCASRSACSRYSPLARPADWGRRPSSGGETVTSERRKNQP